MSKIKIKNPWVGAMFEMGCWRPPKSRPRAFDTPTSLQEDIDAWEEKCRLRDEKIRMAPPRPEARPGFYWTLRIAPSPLAWIETPRSLGGDELLRAVVTLSRNDADTKERIIYSLKYFVTAKFREVLIVELSEVLEVTVAMIKEEIVSYKEKEWVLE